MLRERARCEAPQHVPEARGGVPRADTSGPRWSNRESATNDADNFNAVYDTRPGAARVVVQVAFDTWTRTIGSFNRSGGNNQLDVAVTVVPQGTDTPCCLWAVNAPRVQALFTINNGGAGGSDRGIAVHTARPSEGIFFGGDVCKGQTATGTTGYPGGRRYLPSNVSVRTLGDVYGYTINPPEDFATLYGVVDPDTKTRIISAGDSSDLMEARASGGGVFITLDVGDDVAGTNLDGPFSSIYGRADVNTIVFDGGGTVTLTLDPAAGDAERFKYVRDTTLVRAASASGGYAIRIQDADVERAIIDSGGGLGDEFMEVIGLSPGTRLDVSMGAGANTAFANGSLPDGRYQATLQPGYADAFGNAAAAAIMVGFFVLAGDADRDGAVGFGDLVILAQNHGQSGRTFAQGNFDDSPDGAVGFTDLVLLAQK